MNLKLHIDGGARGNPGPAGAGVVISDKDGTTLLEAGYFLGRATNNVAEYTALLRGLKAAADLGGKRLEIFSDSELLVRQMTGEYRVKSPALQGLFEQAMEALRGFDNWRIRHVPRESNARADTMANRAMDAKRDVVEMELLAAPSTASRPANTRITSVVVLCVNAANEQVCPAPCRAGDRFVIEGAAPQGLCLHLAAAAIPAAIGLMTTGGSSAVDCSLAGCTARVELRPQPR